MMHEAFDKNYIVDDETGNLINTTTGEIIQREYETRAWKHDQHEWDAEYLTPPELCRSRDELYKHVDKLDKRKMVTNNISNLIYKEDHGHASLSGRKPVMKKPQLNLINKLIDILDYRNVIIDTRENLAKKLGIDKSNLIKTLRKLEGIIEISTEKEGIQRGQIKIIVSPVYGFRHLSPISSQWNVHYAKAVSVKGYIIPRDHSGDVYQRILNGPTLEEQFGPREELPEDTDLKVLTDAQMDQMFFTSFGNKHAYN